ncbi:hypothetical protein CKO31_11840 [Thiohalocapsa halophila]|uniref:Cohesin domain-containing protein n=1 Tax=Thiohalocapsa halophila TaxID=69359 RepID=A0ABS1CHS3_9GAMM|nr:hypothetical protein [Thiohalocapsa halophila]MBK1631420.1 hypothetical protein [Thiohalocapsa halophila]
MHTQVRQIVIAGWLAPLFFFGKLAAAAEIGFAPAVQDASDGDRVILDIMVDGLGEDAGPSLGAFDIDVMFDAGAVGFVSYTIGADLGFFLDDSDTSTVDSGVIDLAASSLEDPSTLTAIQGATVELATIVFDVISLPEASSTVVEIDPDDPFLALSDEDFQPLVINGFSDARIRNPPAGAPAPGSIILLAGGWVLLNGVNRDKPARSSRRRGS